MAGAIRRESAVMTGAVVRIPGAHVCHSIAAVLVWYGNKSIGNDVGMLAPAAILMASGTMTCGNRFRYGTAQIAGRLDRIGI